MAWLAVQTKGSNGRGTPAMEAAESISQRISMYLEPPPGEVSIEEFERFAIDRLRGEFVGCRTPFSARTRLQDDTCLRGIDLRTVLKGLEEAKAKGIKGEQLQVGRLGLVPAT